MFSHDILQPYTLVRPIHQGLPSVSLFLFLSFPFYPQDSVSPENLSGGEPAELMMQQSGTKEGRDEHSGGLNYEH